MVHLYMPPSSKKPTQHWNVIQAFKHIDVTLPWTEPYLLRSVSLKNNTPRKCVSEKDQGWEEFLEKECAHGKEKKKGLDQSMSPEQERALTHTKGQGHLKLWELHAPNEHH